MKTMVKIALVSGALALACGTAASGKGPVYTPGAPTPGPKAGLPAKAKAYGRYCQGKSKKHVNGEKGTEFSRCVTNAAQAATHKNLAPGQVCKGESKKHEKEGEKGTEFSRCVHTVVALRRQEHKEDA
jgi:hypothetical protein